MPRYAYHNPKGSFYAQDFTAKNMKDARAKVRKMTGYKRLPDTIGVWKKS